MLHDISTRDGATETYWKGRAKMSADEGDPSFFEELADFTVDVLIAYGNELAAEAERLRAAGEDY